MNLPDRIETSFETSDGYEFKKSFEQLIPEIVEKYNDLISYLESLEEMNNG